MADGFSAFDFLL